MLTRRTLHRTLQVAVNPNVQTDAAGSTLGARQSSLPQRRAAQGAVFLVDLVDAAREPGGGAVDVVGLGRGVGVTDGKARGIAALWAGAAGP
jgi:hypothetical protein